jgi:serine protease Do
MQGFKNIGIAVILFILFVGAAFGGALADRLFVLKPLDVITKRSPAGSLGSLDSSTQIASQQSDAISVIDHVSPGVVTVAITKQQRVIQRSPFQGFDPFGVFGQQQQNQGTTREIKQDIGSGFVVDKDGLIVTNRHVVSDPQATYRVIAADNKEYEVKKVYRDPANDLAILQIEATLPAIELGDSDQLKVGQSVVAIGTALGEFRHTVTTGVISGLGRGITAGDGFSGLAEELDNVIQTDAAINPGNSGGPLLNASGQVIGVNTAIAQGANNIGFALPINVIKESLKNFESTGKFSRPFLGVQYRIIPKQTALLNDMPAGALLIEVLEGASADAAGLQASDVITKFGDINLTTDNDQNILSREIGKHKVGDKVSVEYVRDEKREMTTVTLQESGE